MCLFILKAGRWSWESKSTTPPALDKKLALSNKSFSKCNFVDICDDAVIKGSFSYRWGGKILLLLELNGLELLFVLDVFLNDLGGRCLAELFKLGLKPLKLGG